MTSALNLTVIDFSTVSVRFSLIWALIFAFLLTVYPIAMITSLIIYFKSIQKKVKKQSKTLTAADKEIEKYEGYDADES